MLLDLKTYVKYLCNFLVCFLLPFQDAKVSSGVLPDPTDFPQHVSWSRFLFWSELLSRCQWNLCTQYITQFSPCFPSDAVLLPASLYGCVLHDGTFASGQLYFQRQTAKGERVWWLCSEFIFLLFFIFSSGFVIVVFCSCLSIRMLCQCTGLKTS